ncbi:hypothetical protein HID58_068277, partial [Brassica napus]
HHHPQIGLLPSRMLLPHNIPENEPIFPYLHESRHLHALKRGRDALVGVSSYQEASRIKISTITFLQEPSEECFHILSDLTGNNNDMFQQNTQFKFSGFPLNHYVSDSQFSCETITPNSG